MSIGETEILETFLFIFVLCFPEYILVSLEGEWVLFCLYTLFRKGLNGAVIVTTLPLDESYASISPIYVDINLCVDVPRTYLKSRVIGV